VLEGTELLLQLQVRQQLVVAAVVVVIARMFLLGQQAVLAAAALAVATQPQALPLPEQLTRAAAVAVLGITRERNTAVLAVRES